MTRNPPITDHTVDAPWDPDRNAWVDYGTVFPANNSVWQHNALRAPMNGILDQTLSPDNLLVDSPPLFDEFSVQNTGDAGIVGQLQYYNPSFFVSPSQPEPRPTRTVVNNEVDYGSNDVFLFRGSSTNQTQQHVVPARRYSERVESAPIEVLPPGHEQALVLNDRGIVTPRTMSTTPLTLTSPSTISSRLQISSGALSTTTESLPSTSRKRRREPQDTEVRTKSRRKLEEKKPTKYGVMRRVGACLRCHKINKSCDDETPCTRCTEEGPKARLHRYDCYRDELHNIVAFRGGNSRANQTESKLSTLKWTSNMATSRKIYVTYPFNLPSESPLPLLEIVCREFMPEQHALADVWEGNSGKKMVINFPPWACCQTDDLYKDLSQYIDSCTPNFENDLLIDEKDPITHCTIQEAVRCAQKSFSESTSSTVALALKIRRLVYFCRESMIIVSEDTLGIEKVLDKDFPTLCGTVPVPSVLDSQIDTTAILLMRKLLQQITSDMHKKLYGPKSQQYWYEAFLVSFVLLSCLEKIYELQAKYLGWNEDMQENQYKKISYVCRHMVEQWQYSANVILKHFRVVVHGMTAFSEPWDGPLESISYAAREGINSQTKAYLCKLKGLLEKNDEFLRNAKDQLGQPFVWRSRLFLDDDSIL